MISSLLMARKQLSGFEKGQIVAYNNSRLSLRDLAKKLNRHPSSTGVFIKSYKKTGNYH